MIKKVKAEADAAGKKQPFIPTGPAGASKNNKAQNKKAGLLPTPAEQKAMNEKSRKQREQYDADYVKDYIKELQDIAEMHRLGITDKEELRQYQLESK